MGASSDPRHQIKLRPTDIVQKVNGKSQVRCDLVGQYGQGHGGWWMIVPEKSLASFARHDIEVVAISLVPTYTADLETSIFLVYVDGLFQGRICFFTLDEANPAPALLRPHLQVYICGSWTRTERTQDERSVQGDTGDALPLEQDSHLGLRLGLTSHGERVGDYLNRR